MFFPCTTSTPNHACYRRLLLNNFIQRVYTSSGPIEVFSRSFSQLSLNSQLLQFARMLLNQGSSICNIADISTHLQILVCHFWLSPKCMLDTTFSESHWHSNKKATKRAAFIDGSSISNATASGLTSGMLPKLPSQHAGSPTR